MQATPSWLRILLLLLMLGVVAGLIYANLQFATSLPGGSGFLSRWTAARIWLAEGQSPYGPETTAQVQAQLYGRAANPAEGELTGAFLYPFPAIFLYVPFSLLPYVIARAIWMVLLEVALPLSVFLSLSSFRRTPRAVPLGLVLCFSVLWLPSLQSVIAGGATPLLVLCLSGAMFAIHNRQDAIAGLLLGLSLLIPWLALPIVLFALLWSASRRRWQIVLWASAIVVFLVAIAFLLQQDWLRWWVIQIVSHVKTVGPATGAGLVQTSANPITRFLPWLITCAVFAYMLLEWIVALRKPSAWALWAMLTTLVLSAYILPTWDQGSQVILLPAITSFVAIAGDRWGKQGLIVGIGLLVFYAVGVWIFAFRLPPRRLVRLVQAWYPPSLALMSLWWIRWWIIRRTVPIQDVGWLQRRR